MADSVRGDRDDDRPFAPAEPMEFKPGGGPSATPATQPGQWQPLPGRAGEDSSPLSPPEQLFEPGEIPAGPAPEGATRPTFSVAEVSQVDRLWPASDPEPVETKGRATEHGWVLATVVLVAIFVAAAVGYSVLSAPRGPGVGASGDRVVTLPTTGSSSVPTTSTAVPTTSTAVPTTSIAVPATAPPVAWQQFASPTGTFRSSLPGVPTSAPFPALVDATAYFVSDVGVGYTILDQPFATPSDPNVLRLAMAEAALSVLPPGAAPPTGEVVADPRGFSTLDFRNEVGGDTVIGRVVTVAGRRFVLTMTVPTPRAADPVAAAALVQFRNGFTPTV